jgi:hypothetical protein
MNIGYAIVKVTQFSVNRAIKEYAADPNDRVIHVNHTKNSINNFMSFPLIMMFSLLIRQTFQIFQTLIGYLAKL